MMRNIIGTLSFLLFLVVIPHHVPAQKSMVLRTGVNFNNQYHSTFNAKGLEPGLFFSAGLINDFTPHFGSGIEASFIQRVASFRQDTLNVTEQNNYVDLGVSVRARKEFGKITGYVTGGMLLCFWQGGERRYSTNLTDEKLVFPQARSKLDLGMYLGLGFTYKVWVFECRTLQGLVDISNPTYDKQSLYNQGIMLSLGWLIPADR